MRYAILVAAVFAMTINRPEPLWPMLFGIAIGFAIIHSSDAWVRDA